MRTGTESCSQHLEENPAHSRARRNEGVLAGISLSRARSYVPRGHRGPGALAGTRTLERRKESERGQARKGAERTESGATREFVVQGRQWMLPGGNYR